MAEQTAADRKASLRARTRAVRDALSPLAREAGADLVARSLAEMPELVSAKVVLGYSALRSELDLGPAVAALRAHGVAVAYTRIEGEGLLGVHAVADEAELVPGRFGLLEPPADAPRVAPSEIDAVIVPAVAYDERGFRLGYGGGYYDRLLPMLRPDCLRIGVIFDEQLLAEIPAEAHDERVDVVVTPTRVIRHGRG